MRGSFWKAITVVGLVVTGLLTLGISAFAYTSPGSPSGYVNDFADILTLDRRTKLSEQIHQYKERTGNEIGIAIIQTTGDESIEQYAVQLFQEWGIGKKDEDNGALLLLAIQDRKLRIEVGYGLEGVLTDAKSAHIIANATPLLKQQKYGEAVQQMTDQLIGTLDGESFPGEESINQPTVDEATMRRIFIAVVVFMLLVAFIPFLILVWFFTNRYRFRSRLGGGFSGGGSSWDSSSDSSSSSSDSSTSSSSSDSFGGGSSGGGGASGNW
jgi:uncharacterized protein